MIDIISWVILFEIFLCLIFAAIGCLMFFIYVAKVIYEAIVHGNGD